MNIKQIGVIFCFIIAFIIVLTSIIINESIGVASANNSTLLSTPGAAATATVAAAVTAQVSQLQVKQEASVLKSALWKRPTIEVCWDTPGFNTEKTWVRDAVTRTWDQESALEFVGWQQCAPNNRGIRITIENTWPHTKWLGNQLDGLIEGMVLNFAFQNWSPGCANSESMREYCIEAIAVHEFGHAIGFAHEQNRPDVPTDCLEKPQGTNPDWLVTEFDRDSIMNYCNKNWNNNGFLSHLDIEAVHFLYGGNPGLWVGLSNNDSFETNQWDQWGIGGTPEQMKAFTGDFNGDGKTDVMKFDVKPSRLETLGLWVGLSDGTKFNTSQWDSWWTSEQMKVLAGDFNGDGMTDVMKFDVSGNEKLGLWVGLSDGTKFNTSQWDSWYTSEQMKVLAGDFNGDGMTDVMKFDVPSVGHVDLGLWVGLSDGTKFNTSQWDRWITSKRMKVLDGDFNGDGKTDVMKFDVWEAIE